jgi:AcrR family transcriptional regulator
VTRTPSSDRLTAIAAAATAEFGRVGYRRTRTADVARIAGISSGSVFTYVQSKEALFHLVFLHGFDRIDDATVLPIPTPAPGETLALIEKGLRHIPVPNLRAALDVEQPVDVAAEIRGIVEERYAIFERYWRVLAVIERCAVDLPEIEKFYFGNLRVDYFRQLTRYLDRRVTTGHLRAMPNASAAARVVSESITWFAWHRREGRDAHTYDDDVARETVIAFVSAALVPEAAR